MRTGGPELSASGERRADKVELRHGSRPGEREVSGPRATHGLLARWAGPTPG